MQMQQACWALITCFLLCLVLVLSPRHSSPAFLLRPAFVLFRDLGGPLGRAVMACVSKSKEQQSCQAGRTSVRMCRLRRQLPADCVLLIF